MPERDGPDDASAVLAQLSFAADPIDEAELVPWVASIVDQPSSGDTKHVVLDRVVQNLATCASPAIFGDAVGLLLDSERFIGQVGSDLHRICLQRAHLDPAATLRGQLLAADALEAVTRLTLGGFGSRYGLLGMLTDLPGPVPISYGRAAIRCLAVSWEQWRDPELLATLERLGGLAPPLTSPVDQRRATSGGVHPAVGSPAATGSMTSLDLVGDVAFELGCSSLLTALTAPDFIHARHDLEDAHRRLVAAARGGEGRPDAAAMADVALLLLVHLPNEQGQPDDRQTDFPVLAARLERNVREHVLGYAGLTHWRSPRLDAEVAWVRLARTVAHTCDRLGEPSWYQPATVLSQVLAAYTATRVSHVLQRYDHGRCWLPGSRPALQHERRC
jgi:hypothetical protein